MTTTVASPRPPSRTEDSFVTLHGVDWSHYEMILAMRGDQAGVRMTYLKGELELMSPSIHHEALKSVIRRLLEAFADVRGLVLNGYGSWTVRKAERERGVEPDECYIVGTPAKTPERPDLAIEVVWTEGNIDKLEVYRGLGVPEIWFWKSGGIQVFVLEGDGYREVSSSRVIPGLDLALLVRHLDPEHQTEAVRAFRAALRKD